MYHTTQPDTSVFSNTSSRSLGATPRDDATRHLDEVVQKMPKVLDIQLKYTRATAREERAQLELDGAMQEIEQLRGANKKHVEEIRELKECANLITERRRQDMEVAETSIRESQSHETAVLHSPNTRNDHEGSEALNQNLSQLHTWKQQEPTSALGKILFSLLLTDNSKVTL